MLSAHEAVLFRAFKWPGACTLINQTSAAKNTALTAKVTDRVPKRYLAQSARELPLLAAKAHDFIRPEIPASMEKKQPHFMCTRRPTPVRTNRRSILWSNGRAREKTADIESANATAHIEFVHVDFELLCRVFVCLRVFSC